MPGAIMGIYGQQRSGKTLIAYKLVKSMCELANRQGVQLRVYTNLYCPQDKQEAERHKHLHKYDRQAKLPVRIYLHRCADGL